MALILRYFTEFKSFRGAVHKSEIGFSERELTFTFAMLSPVRLQVCL